MDAVVNRQTTTAIELLYRHRMTTIKDLLSNWNAE
jgi:hypothetical protein